ncbi:hypothetical protein GDO86_001685 [Hymenochirus boettgeri]|uniref:Olfactory receptor n=1 Tax=Hymenochirus boettgeri TaxID=247094 RepID=A0A8T2KEP3_9PIPI|nr:hypothetical protein GDO86_001685 [Hymenochirus boettgeri]
MFFNGSISDKAVTHFILLGFQSSQVIKSYLSFFFSAAYLLAILENVAVILLVQWDPKLHTPMYFFLSKLSCLEIFYVSVTVPKILHDLVTNENTISLHGCILQLYLFLSLACTECFLLTAMAVDRYMAICVPLHYYSMMTRKMCWCLCGSSLFLGFLSCSFSIGLITELHFCGPNIINHYLCDISPLINLSCQDISTIELVNFITALFVLFSSSVPITISYIRIIYAICQIPSDGGWKKSFSTCASHLMVVTIFFGTTIFMYARPKANQSLDVHKDLSVLYTIVIPVINPMIYTLKNNDMKKSLKNIFVKRLIECK